MKRIISMVVITLLLVIVGMSVEENRKKNVVADEYNDWTEEAIAYKNSINTAIENIDIDLYIETIETIEVHNDKFKELTDLEKFNKRKLWPWIKDITRPYAFEKYDELQDLIESNESNYAYIKESVEGLSWEKETLHDIKKINNAIDRGDPTAVYKIIVEELDEDIKSFRLLNTTSQENNRFVKVYNNAFNIRNNYNDHVKAARDADKKNQSVAEANKIQSMSQKGLYLDKATWSMTHSLMMCMK